MSTSSILEIGSAAGTLTITPARVTMRGAQAWSIARAAVASVTLDRYGATCDFTLQLSDGRGFTVRNVSQDDAHRLAEAFDVPLGTPEAPEWGHDSGADAIHGAQPPGHVSSPRAFTASPAAYTSIAPNGQRNGRFPAGEPAATPDVQSPDTELIATCIEGRLIIAPEEVALVGPEPWVISRRQVAGAMPRRREFGCDLTLSLRDSTYRQLTGLSYSDAVGAIELLGAVGGMQSATAAVTPAPSRAASPFGGLAAPTRPDLPEMPPAAEDAEAVPVLFPPLVSLSHQAPHSPASLKAAVLAPLLPEDATAAPPVAPEKAGERHEAGPPTPAESRRVAIQEAAPQARDSRLGATPPMPASDITSASLGIVREPAPITAPPQLEPAGTLAGELPEIAMAEELPTIPVGAISALDDTAPPGLEIAPYLETIGTATLPDAALLPEVSVSPPLSPPVKQPPVEAESVEKGAELWPEAPLSEVSVPHAADRLHAAGLPAAGPEGTTVAQEPPAPVSEPAEPSPESGSAAAWPSMDSAAGLAALKEPPVAAEGEQDTSAAVHSHEQPRESPAPSVSLGRRTVQIVWPALRQLAGRAAPAGGGLAIRAARATRTNYAAARTAGGLWTFRPREYVSMAVGAAILLVALVLALRNLAPLPQVQLRTHQARAAATRPTPAATAPAAPTARPAAPAAGTSAVLVGSHDGALYALSPRDGGLLWRYPTGAAIESAPTAASDAVYIGSNDHTVYALKAGSHALLWRYRTGGNITTVPTVSRGTVYVGSADGYLYALGATDGSVRWQFQAGSWFAGQPVVSGGLVYAGSYDNNLYALRTTDGSERWQYRTGGAVASAPAVVAGVVYVGSSDGSIYAFDAATGYFRWRYQTGGSVFSSPAVVDGAVVVGSFDTYIYALSAGDGGLLWRTQTGGLVSSSPAVAGGVVYIGSNDGNVYALRTQDGSRLWLFKTGGPVSASPAVSGSVVYVGSSDHALYALASADGHLLWSYQTGDKINGRPAVAP